MSKRQRKQGLAGRCRQLKCGRACCQVERAASDGETRRIRERTPAMKASLRQRRGSAKTQNSQSSLISFQHRAGDKAGPLFDRSPALAHQRSVHRQDNIMRGYLLTGVSDVLINCSNSAPEFSLYPMNRLTMFPLRSKRKDCGMF